MGFHRMATLGLAMTLIGAILAIPAFGAEIVHDAEYYILKAQNGERWAAED